MASLEGLNQSLRSITVECPACGIPAIIPVSAKGTQSGIDLVFDRTALDTHLSLCPKLIEALAADEPEGVDA